MTSSCETNCILATRWFVTSPWCGTLCKKELPSFDQINNRGEKRCGGTGCQARERVHRPVESYNLPALHLQSWTEVAPTGAALPGGHGSHSLEEKPSLKESRGHFWHWAPEPILGISCCKQKWHSPFRISSTVKNLSLLATSNSLHQAFPNSESSLESNQESRHTTCPVRTSPARSESKCWRGQNLQQRQARKHENNCHFNSPQILRDEWNCGRHSVLCAWPPMRPYYDFLAHNTFPVPLWFCRSHRRVASAGWPFIKFRIWR